MSIIRIQDREAIPVRALPFVAGTEGFPRVARLPPSQVIQALHQACDAGTAGTPTLRAYALKGGAPATVDAMYLDAAAPISDFPPEMDEPIRDSFSRLPPGMFVFADDLRTFIDWLFPPGALDGQCREVIEIMTELSLPEAVTSKIYQGFDDALRSEHSASWIDLAVAPHQAPMPDEADRANDYQEEMAYAEAKIPNPNEFEEKQQRNRWSKNFAVLESMQKRGVSMNIESIWLDVFKFRGQPDSEFETACDATATTKAGVKIEKRSLKRSIPAFLKKQDKLSQGTP